MNTGRPLKRRAAALLLTALIALLTGCQVPGSVQADEATQKSRQEGKEWFYQSFDEAHRAAYDAFRRSAQNPFDPEPVSFTAADGKKRELAACELESVYQGFLYDHPEVFWLTGTYNYRASGEGEEGELSDAVRVIPIPGSEEELEEEIRSFEAAAEEMLKKTAGARDERERAVILYDSLTQGTEYEEEALYDSTLLYEHTAYGAIAGKKAVCDGIALAYKYLLGRCGIESIVIPGRIGDNPHVWNTVFWEDRWHEADPTWDAAGEANDNRQYFDLTTQEMSKEHEREKSGIALLIPIAE